VFTVVDKIAACKFGPWPATAKRNPEVCEFLVLHRSDSGSTPELVAEFFSDPQHKTGRRMPYHFLIDSQGVVSQCVPLSIVAPGAVKLNPAGIQIALDGDFRKKPPSVKQGLALVNLVAELLKWKPSLKVTGHTADDGATTTPGKICPGKHLVPANVRLAAAAQIDAERKERWARVGLAG
jgi:hypothetical protein